MTAWACLFAPSPASIEILSFDLPPGLPQGLRIYFKPFGIDRTLPLFVENEKTDEILSHFFAKPHPLFPRGVHLQKKNSFSSPLSFQKYFFLRFSGHCFHFVLGFSPEDLEALIHLLSGKAASSLERDTLLEELSHWFQAALTRPPLNFETLITSLSDRNLQWLLQWMLSQHIVSVDMLAAYIWSLEEKGKRLVDNLSQSIRHHVVELMAAYRRERSYRWADEVRYLIHHNLFRHSGPLVSHIAILRTYSDLRRQQTAEDLVRFLQGADHWHASLSHLPRSLRERYASLIPSRFIAAYGSFVPEEVFLSWWHDVISKRGLAILREDRLWWISQPMEKRAFEAMEFLKQWFLLEAKEIIRQEEVPLVLSTLTSSWQIEIITYEIGVAACLYAIKPFETPTDLLPPILCHLLEDIRSKTLTFHNWGDYRIPESQEAFLKAIYVLRRLGRL